MYEQPHSPQDEIESSQYSEQEIPDRMQLIRDAFVFQFKLLADGFRDLLLVPVSMAAAIVSLLKRGSKPGAEFYDLLRLGRRSEHWINLFGAASKVHGPAHEDDRFPGEDIDRLVSRVEAFVVEEYRSGGVTAQAKEKLDRALAAMRRRNSGHP
jgi:hypothetical protein